MKYARKCDVSGKGMNEGWCWGDGSFYTSTLEFTLDECRKDREHILRHVEECDILDLDSIQDTEDFTKLSLAIIRASKNEDTDDDLLLIGYHMDYVYYTEWECEEDAQYLEVSGKLIEIELN